MEAETCANCEEPIAHAPVYFDGRPYCCVGCVAGGPCLCTYQEPAPEARRPAPQPALASAAARPPASAVPGDPRPAPPAPTSAQAPRPAPVPSSVIPPVRPSEAAPAILAGDSREPIPFRRPGGMSIIVHVAGFEDQRQLLLFASVMEQSPDFAQVSLTRVTADEAWLTVRDETPESVVSALMRLPGFNVEARSELNLVEARVGGRAAAVARPADEPVREPAQRTALQPAQQPAQQPGQRSAPPASAAPSREGAPILPQRPRFRAFRPQPYPQPTQPTQPVREAQASPQPSTSQPSTSQPSTGTQEPQRRAARPPLPPPMPPVPVPAAQAQTPAAPQQRTPGPAPAAPAAPTSPAVPSRAPVAPRPASANTPPAPVAAPSDVRPEVPAPLADEHTTPASAPAASVRPPVAPPTAPRPAAVPPLESSATPRPAPPAPVRPVAPASSPAAETQAPVGSPPPAQGSPVEEFVEPEERPGGAVLTVEHLTLVVYPFHSFAALNEFQAAIRSLHGVKNTRVRRFYRGTLHLAVDYEDIIPLSDRLADLRGVEFEIASESRSELEIVLQDTSPLAAAGDS